MEVQPSADTFPKHRTRHIPVPWEYTRQPIDAFPKHKVSELRRDFPTKQEFSWKSFHLHSSESTLTVYKGRLELHVLRENTDHIRQITKKTSIEFGSSLL